MRKPARVRGAPEYRRPDVEVLFRRGNWRSWDDAIHWLEENGEADGELSPAEALAMREYLASLRDTGFRFRRRPDEAQRLSRRRASRASWP
jgi:hypothetical protein